MKKFAYSKTGLALTEAFEGLRLTAYQDIVGVWTIGYGHTKGVKKGDTCTSAQAVTWLIGDVQECVDWINANVRIDLTQNEFDALVDFAFNLGLERLSGSTLWRKLNLGDIHGAADEFDKWSKAGGKIVAGLLRRRLAEKSLFNTLQ